MKTCTNKNCKQINPQLLTNFYPRRNRKNGLISNCKECRKEIVRKSDKLYRKINKEKITLKKKIRRHTNIQCRLIHNLRGRLKMAIKRNYKTGSAIKDLGCSIEELKFYLEKQFIEGMSWENYGNKLGQWSIDHIYPLSKVDLTNREEFLKVNNYKNLRPLWHIDNIKKSNNIINI